MFNINYLIPLGLFMIGSIFNVADAKGDANRNCNCKGIEQKLNAIMKQNEGLKQIILSLSPEVQQKRAMRQNKNNIKGYDLEENDLSMFNEPANGRPLRISDEELANSRKNGGNPQSRLRKTNQNRW